MQAGKNRDIEKKPKENMKILQNANMNAGREGKPTQG